VPLLSSLQEYLGLMWTVTATVSPAHLGSKERRDLITKTMIEVMMRFANANVDPSVYQE
jgi:hypothetical protein